MFGVFMASEVTDITKRTLEGAAGRNAEKRFDVNILKVTLQSRELELGF
jgi:hypothetical protein